MKKLLSLIAIMALGLSTTFAQTPAVKTAAAPAKKTVKKEVKTVAAPAKQETKAATATVKTTATTTAAKASTLKKDGTPDMRLKENKVKAVVKPAGPVKKDGTPDMRYKANKDGKKSK